MSRNVTGQKVVSSQAMMEAKKALQDRWKHLELKPATLLYLQEMMDISGVAAATTVTEAVKRHKEKQGHFTHVGKEWASETLRLLSLEGVRPHLIDVLRFLLEVLLAWHVISLPSVSDEVLNNAVEIALAVLFLLIGLIAICLRCWFHDHFPRSKQQKKECPPSGMA